MARSSLTQPLSRDSVASELDGCPIRNNRLTLPRYCPDRAVMVSIEHRADCVDARLPNLLRDPSPIFDRLRDRTGIDACGGARGTAHVVGLGIRPRLQALAPARIALACAQHELQALGTAEVVRLLHELEQGRRLELERAMHVRMHARHDQRKLPARRRYAQTLAEC